VVTPGGATLNQPRNPDGTFARKFGVGSLITAIVLGLGAAVGAGVEGAGVATGSGASAIAEAGAPRLSLPARTARGKQRTTSTQTRLAVRGVRADLQNEQDSGSCADDARGEVQDFLATHPCESVYRALYEVRRGDVAALVAVAWIEMVEPDDATELKALVDRPGTGNVDQLPPPRGQSVVDVGEPAYASRQDGRLVTTAEVEPVAVTPEQRVLEEIADEAADGSAE
jgi:hypothetical protein